MISDTAAASCRQNPRAAWAGRRAGAHRAGTMASFFLVLFFLAALTAHVFAAPADNQGSAGPYFIRSVSFEIEGATREFVLRTKAGIEPGRRFAGRAELDTFLADRRLVLLNERVLESAELSYETETVAPGAFAVDVTVKTKDTWNIIALPYAKFDSNEGLTFSIKARHYNFFGSMSPLEIDFDMLRTLAGPFAFTFAGKFDLPFEALGRLWRWGLDQELIVWPDQRFPVSRTSLDLSVELPTRFLPVTVSAFQKVFFHDEKDIDSDAYFLSNGISAAATIPTGSAAGKYGNILYKPSLNLSQNWKFDGLVRPDRLGPKLSLGQGLKFGRVDWRGNLRSGLEASFDSDIAWNFYRGGFIVNLDGAVSFFAALRQRVGIAARLSGFSVTGDIAREDLGASLRGILDSRLNGVFGMFFNLNLPVSIVKVPVHAITGKDWLEFELQAGPFVDAGILDETEADPAALKAWYSGGLEVYVFPEIMRSFIVRASAGFDLGHLVSGRSLGDPTIDGFSPYEIYLGVGLLF